MLKKVEIPGINMPTLYMAKTKGDIAMAKENGIPYIIWKYSYEELIKYLLRPILEDLFPYVNWTKVLGYKRRFTTKVHFSEQWLTPAEPMLPNNTVDNAKNMKVKVTHAETETANASKHDRYINTSHPDLAESSISVFDYMMDTASSVNIDALQKLGMLPKFVGDVADCIRTNLGNQMMWTEGWTKKLGCTLGRFDIKRQLPNLIILDVSSSIPRGIAATMLTLINTMRQNCCADLIITAARSKYYRNDEELPDPQWLRQYFRPKNECSEFTKILDKEIRGKEFGHVISFGDYDRPLFPKGFCERLNIKVKHVHHYHTQNNYETGYAKWVKLSCPDVKVSTDNTWCSSLLNGR